MEEGHRLGWGPWGPWPLSAWRYIFYTPRPDLHRSKTRAKEWKLLKSPWRYFHALFFYFGPPSHILYNIKYPYLLVQIISLLVQVVGGYTSAIPWKDEMTSIKTAFTMSSFTMSLLLSFRINQVYTRWKEARQSISGVGNGATNIFMTLFIWLQDQPDKQQLLEDLRRYCIVWPYSVLQVVRGDPALDPIATSLLSHAEMSVYSGSRKGRQVVATAVRNLVREANLPMEQFISVETLIQATIKSSGDALRIKFQAMPQVRCHQMILSSNIFRFVFRLSGSDPHLHWLCVDLVPPAALWNVKLPT